MVLLLGLVSPPPNAACPQGVLNTAECTQCTPTHTHAVYTYSDVGDILPSVATCFVAHSVPSASNAAMMAGTESCEKHLSMTATCSANDAGASVLLSNLSMIAALWGSIGEVLYTPKHCHWHTSGNDRQNAADRVSKKRKRREGKCKRKCMLIFRIRIRVTK